MNLLLDTHTVIWWVNGERLSDAAAEAIREPDNLACVSAATVWEIAIKQALGKLTVDGDLDAVLAEDFEPVPISFEDARRAGALPAVHRDPFDRMLVAQAQARGLVIITRDPVFESYDVKTMRA